MISIHRDPPKCKKRLQLYCTLWDDGSSSDYSFTAKALARASNPEAAAGTGGWCAGKLRARDASGRAVREARSSGTDELREMMAAKRAKVADLAAMRERVGGACPTRSIHTRVTTQIFLLWLLDLA